MAKKVLQYRKSIPSDATLMVERMRQEDIQEFYAIDGLPTKESILNAFDNDIITQSVFDGNEIIAIFGVSIKSIMESSAVPWAVFSNDISKYKILLIEISRLWVIRLNEIFNLLENYVDARNLVSIRYLRAIGFNVQKETTPFGFEKRPFHYFFKEKNHV